MDQQTILLVDDEPNIINSLKRLLRREGYCLLTASSGKEGIRILKENDNISLILSDQRMPEMSGIEFLGQAKTLSPGTIRIILSGYTEVNSIMAAINEGEVYKFITKPWNDEEIKITIKTSLEQYELVKENKELNEKITKQNKLLREKVKSDEMSLFIQNRALLLSQSIVENLPFGITGIDTDKNIVLANSKAYECFGFQPGSLVGQNMENVFPAEITETVDKTIQTSEKLILSGYQYKEIGDQSLLIEFLPIIEKNEMRGIILLVIDKNSFGF